MFRGYNPQSTKSISTLVLEMSESSSGHFLVFFLSPCPLSPPSPAREETAGDMRALYLKAQKHECC